MKHILEFLAHSEHSDEYNKFADKYNKIERDLKAEIKANKQYLGRSSWEEPGEGGTDSSVQIVFGNEPGESAMYDDRPYIKIMEKFNNIHLEVWKRNSMILKTDNAKEAIAKVIELRKKINKK